MDQKKIDILSPESCPKRTERNVLDSDATLIVSHGKMTGGTLLTWDLAKKHSKPCMHIDLNLKSLTDAARILREWLERNCIKVLNVAGSRASKDSKIYSAVKELLRAADILTI